MGKPFFDYDDGDFVFSLSDHMAIDSDGTILMHMSDHLAMDLDSGDVHFTSSWPNDNELNDSFL